MLSFKELWRTKIWIWIFFWVIRKMFFFWLISSPKDGLAGRVPISGRRTPSTTCACRRSRFSGERKRKKKNPQNLFLQFQLKKITFAERSNIPSHVFPVRHWQVSYPRINFKFWLQTVLKKKTQKVIRPAQKKKVNERSQTRRLLKIIELEYLFQPNRNYKNV